MVITSISMTVGNADRHHYETYARAKKHGKLVHGKLLHIDNGKRCIYIYIGVATIVANGVVVSTFSPPYAVLAIHTTTRCLFWPLSISAAGMT